MLELLDENKEKITKNSNSVLYIVPTPIGNLQDITYRALSVLRQVDYIIAEDTRRTRILLNFFSIKASLYVMNRYNECLKISTFIVKLQAGCNMALVSDAGTPLINDPGYYLIKSCYRYNIKVVVLPGPCAAITALCGSGLPTNRFCFEGFLPSKQSVRLKRLQILSGDVRTLIFYDVKHRVIDSLKDMISVFGEKRYVVLARELTKIWESIHGDILGKLLSWVQEDKARIQGEMVLVVSGNDSIENNELSLKAIKSMKLLMSELSLKKSAILVGKMYGIKKNFLYKIFLEKNMNKKKEIE